MIFKVYFRFYRECIDMVSSFKSERVACQQFMKYLHAFIVDNYIYQYKQKYRQFECMTDNFFDRNRIQKKKKKENNNVFLKKNSFPFFTQLTISENFFKSVIFIDQLIGTRQYYNKGENKVRNSIIVQIKRLYSIFLFFNKINKIQKFISFLFIK